MYENEIKPDIAFLVGLDTGEYDAEISMEELVELAKTAGAEVIAETIQKRPTPEKTTCVGTGKLEEIKEYVEQNDVDLLIFDRELSPTQLRNIESATGVRTIDRTMLILDIFAGRAKSSEGKLQVELAQLKYMLPRLTGKGIEMSRLGGGIGTRGPGETKLETDKRHIRRKIDFLKEQLKETEKRRSEIRKRREKNGAETVALVGYTNAGKSTLMNSLTDADVFAQDMLFATLDPTARELVLPDGREVILIDTVGLVRRLPHHLVEAFKSTLEEAATADVVLNVCDASSEQANEHLNITNKLLTELGASEDKIISVLNKCDAIENFDTVVASDNSVRISAKTGFGIENLLSLIEKTLPPLRRRVTVLIPYNEGGVESKIRQGGIVHRQEYTEKGTLLDVTNEIRILEKYIKYVEK